MALVPPCSKERDVVCIVPGAQTPYLLRPVSQPTAGDERELVIEGGPETADQGGCLGLGSVYHLVGECYIHGMMDGEMVDGRQETTVMLI